MEKHEKTYKCTAFMRIPKLNPHQTLTEREIVHIHVHVLNAETAFVKKWTYMLKITKSMKKSDYDT
jgi:hypothetical protein